jgi:hypothetical protein
MDSARPSSKKSGHPVLACLWPGVGPMTGDGSPRTPGILRLSPAAWYTSKAMPPQRPHRPCQWTAAALGVLASRALSATAVGPPYLVRLSVARSRSNAFLSCYWPKATCARGMGAEPPGWMQMHWHIRRTRRGLLPGRDEKVRNSRMSLILPCLFRTDPPYYSPEMHP